MSGWWHPEGPESVTTYWSRRVVVIAAAVLVLILMVVAINRVASGAEPQTAAPEKTIGPGPSDTLPLTQPSSTTPSSAPTSGGSTSSSSSSPSSTADPSSTAEPSSTGESSSTAGSSASAAGDPSTSASADAEATGDSRAPKPSRVPLCDGAKLRATLRGDASTKAGSPVTFSLSLINGSTETCAVAGNAETMELKVYSGADRIWSTADCAEKVPAVNAELKPEQATTWRMRWNGHRSKDGCGTRSEQPQPGTYVATFSYEGADPVRERMTLTAR